MGHTDVTTNVAFFVCDSGIGPLRAVDPSPLFFCTQNLEVGILLPVKSEIKLEKHEKAINSRFFRLLKKDYLLVILNSFRQIPLYGKLPALINQVKLHRINGYFPVHQIQNLEQLPPLLLQAMQLKIHQHD